MINRNIQLEKNSGVDKTIAFLLFLLAMNFNNLFYYITFLLFILSIVWYKNVDFPKGAISVLLFCFTLMIGVLLDKGYIISGVTEVVKMYSYFIAYLLGAFLISNDISEKNIIGYILIIGIGSCAHGALNYISNVNEFGFNPVTRNLPDIWTKHVMSATGQGAVFCTFIGIIYYSLFVAKKSMMMKLMVIAGIVMMSMYNMMTASRTVFILTAAVLLLSYLAHAIIERRIKFVHVMIPILIALGVVFYINDIFDFKTFLESTPLFSRLKDSSTLTNDLRFKRVTYYITNMTKYPLGGMNMREQVGYAHNMFLDLYDLAGFLPFTFLIIFTGHTIVNMFRLIKNKYFSNEFKVLLFSVNIAILIQFMIEPVLDGMPWLVVLYCIINGMVVRMLKQSK